MLFDLEMPSLVSKRSYNCSLESWYGDNISCLFGGSTLCYAHNETMYAFDSASGELLFQKSLGGKLSGGRPVDGAWMWLLEDGRVFSVREDGVSGMDLGVYTDHGIDLLMPVFTGEGAQSFVAISASEPERLLSIRRMEDANASPVALKGDSPRLYDLGRNPVVLVSPSGTQAACLGFETVDYTYDTMQGAWLSGSQLQTNFEASLDYDSDFGFEEMLLTDDLRIVGNRGMYDLTAQQLSTVDLSDMTDGQTTTAPPSLLKDGTPLQAMIHRDFADNTVLWQWQSGQPLPRISCPWRESTGMLRTGADGYLAACAGGRVYVLRSGEESWRELCEGEKIFLAQHKPLIAVLTKEESLALYDLQTGAKLAQITLSLSSSALSEVLFAANDSRLVLISRTGDRQQTEVYDASTGLMLSAAETLWATDYGDWHACATADSLYVFNRRASQADGLCFDLTTGQLRAVMPQMMGCLPGSKEVLLAQGATLDTFRLAAFPCYAAEDLLEQALH